MLVLFDIDDTLLDHRTSAWMAAATLHRIVGSQKLVDEFCTSWSDALERHFARYLLGEVSFENQRRDRVREVIDSALTDETADRIMEQYLAAYGASWLLFPDVLPCLDRLSGCRLGVISNGQGEQQRMKLTRTGIADRFEHILISEEVGYAKPDPMIFHRACAFFGVGPSEAVYIGDRYDVDAQGARAAGLRGVWLDRKREATAAHEPPLIGGLDALSHDAQGSEAALRFS
jgi:putative hydrolase of the HAD superfamily